MAKRFTETYNNMDDLRLYIEEQLIPELEEKRDAIEEKASNKERNMTNKEQERYDELDDKINTLEECKEYLESLVDMLLEIDNKYFKDFE